jgi:PhzF family phenazine biosynthesis protein
MDGPVTSSRRTYRVRYFSPAAEVPFCGHATIAVGVALARTTGAGHYLLETDAGPIPVRTVEQDGEITASLTSVQPQTRPVNPEAFTAALEAIGLHQDDLDPAVAPVVAYAGAWHLIVAVRNRSTLHRLNYDFDRLRELSIRHGWVTVHVAFVERPDLHHVRALFPYGGVVEDPATGAGAAAYACYLRSLGVLRGPMQLRILQGEDMGQLCLLHVAIGGAGPAVVTGTAVPVH